MNLLILVVDDEPDVEFLFRQQFRPKVASQWNLRNLPPWRFRHCRRQLGTTAVLTNGLLLRHVAVGALV